jgi:hypothetical protein
VCCSYVRKNKLDSFLNNSFELIILDMFEQIIFHHQEFCTSSLQYCTVHLYDSLVTATTHVALYRDKISVAVTVKLTSRREVSEP